MLLQKNIFVIMPFSSTSKCTEDEWTEIYNDLFSSTFNDLGYECSRISPETGSLIKSILFQLRTAPIVLADLTDKNPNVFYELGVRHSLSKRTILISQSIEDIPSDLKGYWSIVYDKSTLKGITTFKKEIKKIIKKIEENPDYSDNPVSDFLERENFSISKISEVKNLKKINALLTELSGIRNTLLEITNNNLYKDFIFFDCINLLLNTYYLDLGTKLFTEIYELRLNLKRLIHSQIFEFRIIEECLEQINLIIQSIEIVRAKLAKGLYEEPEQCTRLIWETLEDREKQKESIRQYSKITVFENTNFDELN